MENPRNPFFSIRVFSAENLGDSGAYANARAHTYTRTHTYNILHESTWIFTTEMLLKINYTHSRCITWKSVIPTLCFQWKFWEMLGGNFDDFFLSFCSKCFFTPRFQSRSTLEINTIFRKWAFESQSSPHQIVWLLKLYTLTIVLVSRVLLDLNQAVLMQSYMVTMLTLTLTLFSHKALLAQKI